MFEEIELIDARSRFPMGGHVALSNEDEFWVSREGYARNIQLIDAAGPTIRGEFEATLFDIRDEARSKHVRGRFEGKFLLECWVKVSPDEDSRVRDSTWSTDFCASVIDDLRQAGMQERDLAALQGAN